MRRTQLTFEEIEMLMTYESGGYDYWANIVCDDHHYAEAKKKLVDSGNECPCYETILAQMIRDGMEVFAYDFEEDEKHLLTKENLLKGFNLNAKAFPKDASLIDGDADTGDRVMQYAVFGEVIYG